MAASVNPFFTPTQISGCQMWLDAADPTTVQLVSGVVSQWTDKSGSGNSATQATAASRPRYGTVNTSRAVIFTGSPTFMNLPTITSVPVSLFMVSAATVNLNNTFFVSLGSNPNAIFIRELFSPDVFGIDGGSGSAYATSIRDLNTHLWSFTLPGSASGVFAFDGSVISSSGFTLTANTSFTTNSLGSWNQNSANGNINGGISELLMYNSALTTFQRQQIEGYLAWKWGLQASLPSNHPYKNSIIPPLLNPPIRIPQTVAPSFFQPTQVSGCQLWLDAADSSTVIVSGSNVTQWNDKSGNGIHANQAIQSAQPTYTNRTLVFTSSQTLVNTTFRGFTTAFTVYMVYYPTAVANAYPRALYIIPGSSAWALFDSTQIGAQTTSTGGYTIYGSRHLNQTYIVGLNGTSGSLPQYGINGSTFINTATPYTQTQTTFGYNIGNSNVAAGTQYTGTINEIIVYNTSLALSQRQQIEGYLAWKWGLQGNLLSNHPYKSSPIPPLLNPPLTLANILGISWQPTQISGCSLWLDAADITTFTLSGTNITAWRDKSGNNRNTTNSPFSTPTLQNQTVTFTGTNGLRFSTTFPSFYDIFVVGAPLASTASWRTLLQIDGGTASHIILVENGSTRLGNWFGSFRQFGALTWSGTRSLLFARLNPNLTMNASFNGTVELTAATAAVGAASSGSINFGNANGSTQAWGDVNEILLYSSALSTAQRQQVEGYLAWKWGLVGSLPTTHPWKRWPPPP